MMLHFCPFKIRPFSLILLPLLTNEETIKNKYKKDKKLWKVNQIIRCLSLLRKDNHLQINHRTSLKFEDTLSLQNKENIIKQVSAKDTLHWKFKDIPEEGVAEFYNIRYSDTDTIPYSIVITNDKVYVAYDNKVYYPDLSDIFSSNDYRLLAERTWLIGPDSSHEYVVKFNLPYSHYIKELRKNKTIEYKETRNLISITKNIYSKHDSDYLQAKYEIEINKKKNTAFIKYGTY